LKLANGKESCQSYFTKKKNAHFIALLSSLGAFFRYRSVLPGFAEQNDDLVLLKSEDVNGVKVRRMRYAIGMFLLSDLHGYLMFFPLADLVGCVWSECNGQSCRTG
jgi:hypothetical protein